MTEFYGTQLVLFHVHTGCSKIHGFLSALERSIKTIRKNGPSKQLKRIEE